jgi:hypothetical protein
VGDAEETTQEKSGKTRVAGASGKKRKTRVNKTEEIRSVASKMVAKGHRPRPLEIVAALKKQGIHVVGSQVSMALKGTGMEYRPQQGQRASLSHAFPDLTTAVNQVGIDDLLVAREFVQRLGTIEKAEAALVVLKQFGGEAMPGSKALSGAGEGISSEASGRDRSPPDDTKGPEMRKVV